MNLRTLTAGALLIGCIGLLQYHSIAFWSANVDPLTGAFWSVVIEGAALWLWSDRRLARRALGVVATLLLLAGPMYQVSAPLFQEEVDVVATAERRAELQGEVTQLQTSLAVYEANSQERGGWAKRIDATQARLDAARAELAAQAAAAPERMEWQRQAVIGLQALAIALLQLVGVLCISELRQAAQEPAGAHPEETEANAQGESAASASQDVPRGLRRLHRPTPAAPNPLRAAAA
jgi:hypothetical protein